MDHASDRYKTVRAAAAKEAGTRNQNWYCLHYTPEAPPGLPPIIQADQVLRYTDDITTWLAALWVPISAGPCDGAAATILQVRAAHVADLTRHDDMGQAARAHSAGPPATGEPEHPPTAPDPPAR